MSTSLRAYRSSEAYSVTRKLCRWIMPLLAAASSSVSPARTGETLKCLPTILAADGSPSTGTRLRDQSGRKTRANSFQGQIVIATMLPRECDTICAMRVIDLDQMARELPATLSSRVALVATDTGGRSAADVRRLIGAWRLGFRRWSMLSGATGSVRERLDVAPVENAEPSSVVALFDASGLLRQRYSGAPLDRERLSQEIVAVDLLSRAAPALACSEPSPVISSR